jgi:hypothetical protein
VFVGSVVWLIDMHFCDSLQFFINFLGGITPHIFWHLGAGYATYFMILLMIVIRCQHLGRIPTVEWWCMGLIPIVKVIKSADYDQ